MYLLVLPALMEMILVIPTGYKRVISGNFSRAPGGGGPPPEPWHQQSLAARFERNASQPARHMNRKKMGCGSGARGRSSRGANGKIRRKQIKGSWGQKKWPLRLRFLDPTLSVSSLPLPESEYQPEGATSCRVFLPATPPGDLCFYPGRLQPPSATNKPVKPVRHSSAGVQSHA